MSTIDLHPGDAAVQCFGALQAVGDVSLDKLAGDLAGPLAPLRTEVAATVTATGAMPAALPLSSGCAYAALRALNEVLGDLDLTRASAVPAALAYLRSLLMDTGRLDTGRYGAALVPRHTVPGRVGAASDGLAGHLDSILLVPGSAWEQISIRRPRIDRLSVSTRVSGIPIAGVPFYGRREDVQFVEHPGERTLFYSAGPAPALDRRARVRAALQALDTSGASVGMVPELTLDEETLAEWSAAITDIDPGSTPLRWILIGTGAVSPESTASHLVHGHDESLSSGGSQPVNRAVLVDRVTGQVVLTQAKNHGFAIAEANVRNWNLTDELSLDTHSEWLDSARQLNVLDTAHGRLAILICEDLGRTLTMGSLAAQLGVAVVLSPIFGATLTSEKPTDQKSWAQEGAEALATGIGSRVAVTNSLAITRTYRDTGTPTVTLFTARPQRPPVLTYGVTVAAGLPPSGVDTTSLAAEVDAVTARLAHW